MATERIGNYECLELLAEGAQGQVWKARSLVDNPPVARKGEIVALKTLQQSLHDEDALDHFRRRGMAICQLSHPNLVQYRDVFVTQSEFEEWACLVLEYLEGQNFQELLKKQHRRRLPWEQLLSIFDQILEALIYARSEGVIHRDIKPSNIFVTSDGAVKLIDFDVASRMGSSQPSVAGVKGTFEYMAPDFVPRFSPGEDFAGDELSDIFSLGVCFYEALVGRLPFDPLGEDAYFGYWNRWQSDQTVEPSFRSGMFRVLSRCRTFAKKVLAAKREARFQTFEELRSALHEIKYRVISTAAGERYELRNWLDRGAFKEIFLAVRRSDGREVALGHLFHQRHARRFEKEARILKGVAHPHIVEYIDFFELGSEGRAQFFMALEFLHQINDWNLRQRIKKADGTLPEIEVIRIFANYLAALEYLHSKGVVHRDIKPNNLYAPEGHPERAKIFDLGVARDLDGTQTVGHVPGTLDYMAPEFAQAGHDRGTPQSDIYAMGLCLYEALTGKPTFPRLPTDSKQAPVQFMARARGPMKVDFSHDVFLRIPEMEAVLRKALAKDPKKRYASAEKMRAELEPLVRVEVIGEDTYRLGGELCRVGARAMYEGARTTDGRAVHLLALSPAEGVDGASRISELRDCGHSALASYLDYAECREDGRKYLALEPLRDVKERTVQQYLERRERVPLDRVLDAFLHFFAALAHVHSAGILVGVLTPGDLFLPANEKEDAKIISWGLLSVEGELDGSAAPYMPPEFTEGEAEVTKQGDIYSLALCLYETLLGRKVSRADQSRVEISAEASAFRKCPPLYALLKTALAAEPLRRHASAEEVRYELQECCKLLGSSTFQDIADDSGTRLTSLTSATLSTGEAMAAGKTASELRARPVGGTASTDATHAVDQTGATRAVDQTGATRAAELTAATRAAPELLEEEPETRIVSEMVRPPEERPRTRPEAVESQPQVVAERSPRKWGRIIAIAAVVVILLGLGGGLWLARPRLAQAADARKSSALVSSFDPASHPDFPYAAYVTSLREGIKESQALSSRWANAERFRRDASRMQGYFRDVPGGFTQKADLARRNHDLSAAEEVVSEWSAVYPYVALMGMTEARYRTLQVDLTRIRDELAAQDKANGQAKDFLAEVRSMDSIDSACSLAARYSGMVGRGTIAAQELGAIDAEARRRVTEIVKPVYEQARQHYVQAKRELSQSVLAQGDRQQAEIARLTRILPAAWAKQEAVKLLDDLNDDSWIAKERIRQEEQRKEQYVATIKACLATLQGGDLSACRPAAQRLSEIHEAYRTLPEWSAAVNALHGALLKSLQGARGEAVPAWESRVATAGDLSERPEVVQVLSAEQAQALRSELATTRSRIAAAKLAADMAGTLRKAQTLAASRSMDDWAEAVHALSALGPQATVIRSDPSLASAHESALENLARSVGQGIRTAGTRGLSGLRSMADFLDAPDTRAVLAGRWAGVSAQMGAAQRSALLGLFRDVKAGWQTRPLAVSLGELAASRTAVTGAPWDAADVKAEWASLSRRADESLQGLILEPDPLAQRKDRLATARAALTGPAAALVLGGETQVARLNQLKEQEQTFHLRVVNGSGLTCEVIAGDGPAVTLQANASRDFPIRGSGAVTLKAAAGAGGYAPFTQTLRTPPGEGGAVSIPSFSATARRLTITVPGYPGHPPMRVAYRAADRGTWSQLPGIGNGPTRQELSLVPGSYEFRFEMADFSPLLRATTIPVGTAPLEIPAIDAKVWVDRRSPDLKTLLSAEQAADWAVLDQTVSGADSLSFAWPEHAQRWQSVRQRWADGWSRKGQLSSGEAEDLFRSGKIYEAGTAFGLAAKSYEQVGSKAQAEVCRFNAAACGLLAGDRTEQSRAAQALASQRVDPIAAKNAKSYLDLVRSRSSLAVTQKRMLEAHLRSKTPIPVPSGE